MNLGYSVRCSGSFLNRGILVRLAKNDFKSSVPTSGLTSLARASFFQINIAGKFFRILGIEEINEFSYLSRSTTPNVLNKNLGGQDD